MPAMWNHGAAPGQTRSGTVTSSTNTRTPARTLTIGGRSLGVRTRWTTAAIPRRKGSTSSSSSWSTTSDPAVGQDRDETPEHDDRELRGHRADDDRPPARRRQPAVGEQEHEQQGQWHHDRAAALAPPGQGPVLAAGLDQQERHGVGREAPADRQHQPAHGMPREVAGDHRARDAEQHRVEDGVPRDHGLSIAVSVALVRRAGRATGRAAAERRVRPARPARPSAGGVAPGVRPARA